MPIIATQILAYLEAEKSNKMHPALTPAPCDTHQKSDEVALPSFDIFPSTESCSVGSTASIEAAKKSNNGQLVIASLSTFSKYFHPKHGLYRDHHEIDFTDVLDDGLPNIGPEDVEWLIVDLRFVIADEEWDAVDQQVSPRTPHRQLPAIGAPPFSAPTTGILFPHVYKLSLIGAEYIEATLTDARAKALCELVLDRLNPREIMEVEWLTAGDQEPCASTLSSHLVHPLIIKAGNKWSSDTEVNPLADGHLEGEDDEVNSDGMALTQPIGPRGEDIGLRCLRVQGGFPMPNPTLDSSSAYALKPDFSFAFKDWIKGGVETLIWSFKGEYSEACTLGILRHLFKYLAGYYAASSTMPCSLMILQDLNPQVVQKLQSEDATTMRRCGADDFSADVKAALADVLYVESDPNEAGSRIFERVWESATSKDAQYPWVRALRRLMAELVANDKACRRRASDKNTSANAPPKLFTIGPTLHSTSDNHAQSPLSPLSILRSPLSSRSHSYTSTHQDRSSHSGSSASLNTLGDQEQIPTAEILAPEVNGLEEVESDPIGLQDKASSSVALNHSSSTDV